MKKGNQNNAKPWSEKTWKEKTWEIIFHSDTFPGKLFDEVLLALIVLSILLVMLESIESFRLRWEQVLNRAEWFFTIIFTVEYVIRIIVSPKPQKYIFSFLGVVDFLAIIPTYIALIVPEAQTFIIIRSIRLLRIYRILKLYRFIRAGNLLILALVNSLRKISIFMLFILVLVIMLGSLMYVVEGGQNGYYNIPLSIYWAVITLTTVGYGDIVPITGLGKFIATFIMLLGYSIIAIPTGIVSIEMSRNFGKKDDKSKYCSHCNEESHDLDANFCRVCGSRIV